MLRLFASLLLVLSPPLLAQGLYTGTGGTISVAPSNICSLATWSTDQPDETVVVTVDWKCIDEEVAQKGDTSATHVFAVLLKAIHEGRISNP